MDFTEFNDGVELLQHEAKLHAEMKDIAKDGKEYNTDPALLKRVKDYVHYYMNDWEPSDPFTPLPDIDWKCKLVKPFRTMRRVIIDLRETGRLDMLDPIIAALEADGIHLNIDTYDIKYKNELDQIIDGMNAIQTSICETADERKELAQAIEDQAICTKGCFNKTIKQMQRVAKNDEKTDDAVSKIYENVMNNNRDNNVFGEFIREHEDVDI